MNKKYLTYENKILGQEVERLAKEVERLEKVNQMLLNSMVTEAHTKETKEIERRNNIINKAIEYIEENSDDMHTYISQVLTDILKGSEKE